MKKIHSVLLASAILSFIGLSVALNLSLLYPFAAAFALSLAVLTRLGCKAKDLVRSAWSGIVDCNQLYLVILFIGANISVWMASGVVPAVMYYGFQYLTGLNFLFMAFIVTSVMAVFMGTAVGTISTLGIALLGIGRGLAIPPGLLLGVLVSAAYIADKVSPISGLLNLTLKATETSFRPVLVTMSRTLAPVFAFSAAVYFLLGTPYIVSEGSQLTQHYQEALSAGFVITPWLLLLPVVVVILPLTGVRLLPAIAAGLAAGTTLAVTVQGVGAADIARQIIFGFRGATGSEQLNAILVSGGLAGMLEVLLIIVVVIGLGSMLERSGILKPLIYDPVAKARSRGELVLRTGLVSGLLSVVTCEQTAAIVLPGKLFRDKFQAMGVDRTVLARTISDTGTIIAPLMPWNVNGIIIALITGISVLEYAPYALLCYLFPLTILGVWGQEAARRQGHPLFNLLLSCLRKEKNVSCRSK